MTKPFINKNIKNISVLCFGNFISSLGYSVYMVILPWLILEISGSKIIMSQVTSIAFLPTVIFGVFSSVIIDKYSKKRIMIYSDLFRAIIVAIIPALIILELLSVFWISLITFLLASISVFYNPSRDSMIPQIFQLNYIRIANSFISMSTQIAQVLGPLLAGIGISFVGFTHLFAIDAITFLSSAYVISFLIASSQNTFKLSNSKFKSLKNAFIYLKLNRSLIILFSLTFINNLFIMGPAFIGIPIYVKEILRESFIVYTYLESAMAFGMIIGSIFFLRLSKSISSIYLLILGIIIDGSTFSLLYFVTDRLYAICIIFIHGIGISMITISRLTFIQAHVAIKYVGRILTMIYILIMGATYFSIIITGLVLEVIGSDVLFLCIGIFASLTALIGFHPSLFKLTLND